MRLPARPEQGLQGSQLWRQVEERSPLAGESRLGPGLKGLSLLSPPGAAFAEYYRCGASGPKAQREAQRPPCWDEEGAGKKALACPQLWQPGLRHRLGQLHPCTRGLECGASYPMAMGPASNLSKWSLQRALSVNRIGF